MNGIQRVRLAVDGGWQLTITLPDGTVLPPRTLGRVKVPGPSTRDTPAFLPWPPLAGGAGPAAAEVQLLADRCRRIAQRAPASNETKSDFDVVEAGRHLFETLLGGGIWNAITAAVAGAHTIELALQWSKDDRDLHRLNWELMHGPQGFLAAGFNDAGGKPVRVAVSRVVSEAPPVPRAPSSLPRILFVIGCALDDPRIRAGAELFALLRQIKAKERGGTIVTQRYLPIRVLQNASAERLAATMREFQPEIVHIISHGLAEPNAAPCLLLQPDAGQQGEQWKDPAQLLDLLTVDAPGGPGDRRRPSVVVLSACYTGIVDTQLGGPAQGGPLAAQLVAGGIPVVVGMAGQVADQACRLFTRTFGEGLVYGKPLLAAMEAGRRAAFTLGDWPRRAVDWALPALYRAPDLPAGFCITAPDRSPDEQWLQDALVALGLERNREPTFAARFEVLDVHYDRLRRGSPGGLLVQGESGSGKSRLLRELAAQAVADGHLPLLISDEPPDPVRFKDRESVRLAWIRSLGRMCKGLRLPWPDPCQLLLLETALAGGSRTGLHPEVSLALNEGPRTLLPLLRAVEIDLRALLATARAAAPARHGTGALAWLLIDHLHLYPPELQESFFDSTHPFTSYGLSVSSAAPLPVVFALDHTQPAAQLVKDIATGKGQGWLEEIMLKPFPDGTDVLSYGRVLLNPHNPTLYKSRTGEPISEVPWVIDLAAPKDDQDEWLGNLRHWLERQPSDFLDVTFYRWVDMARKHNVVRLADDEDKLRHLQP